MVSAIVGLIASLGAGTSVGIATSLPPVQNWLVYGAYNINPNRLPDPTDAITLRHRGLIKKDDFTDIMRKNGFSEEQANRLWQASYNLLSAELVTTLFRRGFIKEDTYYAYMARLGWSKKRAQEFELATRFYPTASDIIRFAVREVYTPEVRKKYGLDEDMPPIFIKEAAKIGLDEEQARNYWAAKWVLPSVEMGFEMLHRGVIGEDDLMVLLRVHDIMPYWRDKLKAISYRPYTRVDVRRMYQFGVLDREDVKRAYLDIGYDEEKAERMTEFTIAWAEPEHRRLSRTMIEKAYIAGEISREMALELLKRLGYDEPNAELILRLKELSEEEEELEDKIDTIVANFKSGTITQEEAIERLDALNLKASYRDKIVAKSLRAKEKAQRLPSKADLEAWYKLGLINAQLFTEYMEKLGYLGRDIELYLKELQLEAALKPEELVEYGARLARMREQHAALRELRREVEQLVRELTELVAEVGT